MKRYILIIATCLLAANLNAIAETEYYYTNQTKTEQVIEKTKDMGAKVKDSTVNAYEKTKDAGIKAKDYTVNAYEVTRDTTIDIKDATVDAYEKAKDVTIKTGEKTKETGRKIRKHYLKTKKKTAESTQSFWFSALRRAWAFYRSARLLPKICLRSPVRKAAENIRRAAAAAKSIM